MTAVILYRLTPDSDYPVSIYHKPFQTAHGMGSAKFPYGPNIGTGLRTHLHAESLSKKFFEYGYYIPHLILETNHIKLLGYIPMRILG